MFLNRKLLLYLTIFVLLMLLSCTTGRHSKKGVEAAMKQYDYLIMKLDADSIALLYTPDGDLGNIAHGRDSIKKFLSTFKNLKVLSQFSTTESIKITGDTSLQKGIYHQTVIIGEKDTVAVKGEYTATWLWMRKSGWHIRYMETKPIK